MVVTDVVTVSQSDEENTLIESLTSSSSGSKFGSTSGSESASASGSEPAHASGFGYRSATGSGSHEKDASFDEATSSEAVLAPRNNNPTPVAGEPNKWCVEGQWQIYRDTKMLNEKEKMARLITEERRVLTGSLHTVPEIHRLFNLHKWSISKRAKPTEQDSLTSTIVRGCPIDISRATISQFLYGPITGHSWSLNTTKFDYRWDIVRGVRVADSTTDGAVLIDASTTEGDLSVDLAGSEKPDPPVY
uniref:Integrase core domain containing protein n=1 Tax=Solanum tuberosum TaxID=4113 RepID=M1DYT2_SOLTU